MFYECLDYHLGNCGEDGYPRGYGYRYCKRFGDKKNLFDTKVSFSMDYSYLAIDADSFVGQ